MKKIITVILPMTMYVSMAYGEASKDGGFFQEDHHTFMADKGDELVYRSVLEEEDPDGDLVLFNTSIGENVRAKRVVTEKTETVKEKDSGMKYGFPLEVGTSWGGDAGDVSREDMAYKYFVEKQEDVIVPAGKFKDCFKIVYVTGPDTIEEWYYPGVGIVKKTYRHNGPILHETVELMNIIKNLN